VHGNDISNDQVEVIVESVIAASKNGVNTVTTKEVITIVPKNSNALKSFDGVRFTITMRAKNGSASVAGVRLNAYKQTIKVLNLKVQKNGKIAVDLND
jgi:thiamine pyrophosphokinase